MSREPLNQELEDLVREYVLGGEEGRDELNELLRRNEDARPIAARVLFEDAALIAELRLEEVKSWAHTLQPRTIGELAGSPRPVGRRRHLAIALAAAACVGLSAWVVFHPPAAPRSGIVVDAPENKRIGTIRQFDQGDGSNATSSSLESGAFEIGAGKARIDLDNGVVISVTGPAKLAIGLRDCRLWRGQVGVEVPEDLGRYIVQTDDCRFVDLGTIFTVSAQPGKRTEMTVEKGLVRAERISLEGDVISEKLVRKEEGVILDGSTREIEVVKATTLGHEAPFKIADLPFFIPQAYRDAVLAAGPMIVWDFERQFDPSTFGNRVGNGYSLKINGTANVQEGGADNHYLTLGVDGKSGWLESLESWRKESDSPFTVELWARPNSVHWGSLLSFWVNNPFDPVLGKKLRGLPTYLLLEFTHSRDFQDFPSEPSLRCCFRTPATEHPTKTTPDGFNGQIFSPGRYEPGKWHHVVARVDHEELVLFLDGQPVDRRSSRLPHLGEVELALRLGALHNDGNLRQYTGAIDEVAIYPRALSNEEITDHFQKVHEANR